MATFVLVHGAWGGAHGWRKVRRLLRQQGHEVFTPSLTGIGERAHLTSPQVNVSTHIDDVVNMVYYEDLAPITLVGFSYGGMVVTGALAALADRVEHLVFLDAFVPTDGQRVSDLVPLTNFASGDWLIPPLPRTLDDPAETEWNNQRRSHQPIRTFTEPVNLTQPLEDFAFSLTYIKALDDSAPSDPSGPEPLGPFWAAAARAQADARWRYHEINGNHMIPFNQPAELVAILTAL